MDFKLGIIRGDGIGPEVIDSAIKVAEKIGKVFSHEFYFEYLLAGGAAIDETGVLLPEETVKSAKASDAVLLGAVGGYKWDGLPLEKRPEKALLGIRKELNLYANLRPAKLISEVSEACPLRKEIREKGFDIMIVRELTGGMYFGEKGRLFKEGKEGAFDTEFYFDFEIDRILETAFKTAEKRRGKLTLVDKANVLESSRLWRERLPIIAKRYPKVEISTMFIDNATMQIIKQPSNFDVIVTSNMFGDILSDEASELTGSIGLIPSASLGESSLGMYEAIHGSAPDIAGQNIANPIATVLSFAMLLKYSLNLFKEAEAVERAVSEVLKQGYRTKDIFSEGKILLGTKEITCKICENVR